MRKTLWITLIASLPSVAIASANPEMGSAKVVKRGGDFTGAAKVTLDEVAKTPDKFAGKTLEVSGTVGTICLKKGCWLGLAGSQPGVNARVTFKDYAFFAPMDCKGADARIEGVISVKKLSDGERAHLAGDEGKKVEEIPAVELRITASALELTRK